MSKQYNDRRIIRTKHMIQGAFTELLEEKGFDGITISNLTEKANINRGTFYLHYRDKYDLLEQSEMEIIKGIEEIATELLISNLKEVLSFADDQDPSPFIIRLFEYLLEHSKFVKVILGSKGDPSFQAKLKEMMRINMLRNMGKLSIKSDMIVPAEYLIAYVCSTYLGVIQHWLESGMKESPRDISLILSRVMFLGPANILGLQKTKFGRTTAVVNGGMKDD